MRRSRPAIERIMEKVAINPATECWEFGGKLRKDGYAVVGVGRRGEGLIYAHRATYEFYVGPIEEDLVLDHLCRVHHCVNPEHLEPVTRGENVRRGAPFRQVEWRKNCQRGHPFDEKNTYIDRNGHQNCRSCKTLSARRSRGAA